MDKTLAWLWLADAVGSGCQYAQELLELYPDPVELYDLLRMVHAAPAEVGDMDKSVYAAQVDEYAVGGYVLDRTFEYLTFFELGHDFLLLRFELLFDERLVRYNHVTELLVDFHHLELHGLVHVHVVVADGLHVYL